MRILALILVVSLFATTAAFAGDTGPLTAGKPAGVRAAQSEDISPWVYVGIVAVGIGIALAVSDNGSNGQITNTTAPVTTGTTS